MRKRKREKPFPPKNKVLQDLERNEENGYPDPNYNKTKIKLYQGTQRSPQEHSERRNPTSNQ
jgi:hypothetical protein